MTELSETPFRIYRTKSLERGIECVVSTDEFSVGEALVDLRKKGVPVVGIMYRAIDDEPGTWLVSPWESAAHS